MVVAMLVGMLALGPLWRLGFAAFDASSTMDRPDVMAMSMATSMAVAMSLWMWLRGHGAASITEMALAMYLPFAVLLVPLWLGLLSVGGLMTLGHVAMLGTMLLAMLRRRDEYTGHHRHHHRWSRRAVSEPAAEAA
ncbi:hypothetical protein [Actinophytocola xanthii]|nr:hypothetical protein [Actinophytocola xanthii]